VVTDGGVTLDGGADTGAAGATVVADDPDPPEPSSPHAAISSETDTAPTTRQAVVRRGGTLSVEVVGSGRAS
jgi:hypothetical protein